MSGHSKWSSIKHKKGAADAKRGKLFSKLTRAIIVAAKEGGPDPAGNLALQNAIEKAKAASMPKDNIDRAIAKGAGTDADSAAYETVIYEGYGPAGVAVIVEALTDNRNRTAGEVRHTFDKNDGNLGTSGAVAWLFERRGLVLVPADGTDEDELMLAAAEGGADDVSLDGSSFQVLSAATELAAVREAVEGAGFEIESAELTMLPEDHRGRRGRERGEEDPAPDGRSSRRTTTCRRSTRTSTSQSGCWSRSRADARDRDGTQRDRDRGLDRASCAFLTRPLRPLRGVCGSGMASG